MVIGLSESQQITVSDRATYRLQCKQQLYIMSEIVGFLKRWYIFIIQVQTGYIR